jgi:dUTP pyrophosphatase
MIDFITIKPNKKAIIPTGLYFEIPENFEIQIRPRSGLAAKNGVTVLNTPGTIDADYRGEIQIILINFGDEDFTIKHGDRIAQGVLAAVTAKNYVAFVKLSSISENTERGAGGLGSTGKN